MGTSHAAFVNDDPDVTFVADDGAPPRRRRARPRRPHDAARAPRTSTPRTARRARACRARGRPRRGRPGVDHAHRWTFAKPADSTPNVGGSATASCLAGDQSAPTARRESSAPGCPARELAAALLPERGLLVGRLWCDGDGACGLDTVAPGVLGGVERAVGLPEQALARGVVGHDGDAEGRGHLTVDAGDRLALIAARSFSAASARRSCPCREQHRELLAAVAGDEVAPRTDSARRRRLRRAPRRPCVAVGVVDVLEVVEVERAASGVAVRPAYAAIRFIASCTARWFGSPVSASVAARHLGDREVAQVRHDRRGLGRAQSARRLVGPVRRAAPGLSARSRSTSPPTSQRLAGGLSGGRRRGRSSAAGRASPRPSVWRRARRMATHGSRRRRRRGARRRRSRPYRGRGLEPVLGVVAVEDRHPVGGGGACDVARQHAIGLLLGAGHLHHLAELALIAARTAFAARGTLDQQQVHDCEEQRQREHDDDRPADGVRAGFGAVRGQARQQRVARRRELTEQLVATSLRAVRDGRW